MIYEGDWLRRCQHGYSSRLEDRQSTLELPAMTEPAHSRPDAAMVLQRDDLPLLSRCSPVLLGSDHLEWADVLRIGSIDAMYSGATGSHTNRTWVISIRVPVPVQLPIQDLSSVRIVVKSSLCQHDPNRLYDAKRPFVFLISYQCDCKDRRLRMLLSFVVYLWQKKNG